MLTPKGKIHTLGIVVEGISNFMTTVAAAFSDSVNQGYLDFWFTYRTLLKGKVATWLSLVYNKAIQKNIIEYITELTSELKRLERVEQDSTVLDNIRYLLELTQKLSPE